MERTAEEIPRFAENENRLRAQLAQGLQGDAAACQRFPTALSASGVKRKAKKNRPQGRFLQLSFRLQ
jgi:hypothetical protein